MGMSISSSGGVAFDPPFRHHSEMALRCKTPRVPDWHGADGRSHCAAPLASCLVVFAAPAAVMLSLALLFAAHVAAVRAAQGHEWWDSQHNTVCHGRGEYACSLTSGPRLLVFCP
jgi:hypothetical protein